MARRTKKVVLYALVALLLLTVLGAAAALVATVTPENYRPYAAQLSQSDREDWARDFLGAFTRNVVDKARSGAPFEWTMTQHELNGYISSAGEIGRLMSASPGDRRAAAGESALTNWCVVVGEGSVDVMAEWPRFRTVLSVTLSVRSESDGRLRLEIDRVRAGALPVPGVLVRPVVSGLVARAEAAGARGERRDAAAGFLALLKTAADGQARPVETTEGLSLRIADIKAGGGKLTVHFVPTPGAATKNADED